MDLMSPSDPFVVIYVKDEQSNKYIRVGTTEIIWDSPNPIFSKNIQVNYTFEQVQTVKLDVFDAGNKKTQSKKRNII